MPGSIERGAPASDAFLPFDVFMEQALYSPDGGFYQQRSEVIGPDGAYYTAPHASPLYAAAFAQRVGTALRGWHDAPAPRIVEVGPGNGLLAAGIITELGRQGGIPAGVSYDLVDRAAPRLSGALHAAERAARPTGIRVRRAASLGEGGPFRGVVLFHELLDAQPARRFEVARGAWRELGVSTEGTRRTYRRRIARDLPPAMPSPHGLEEGTIVEIAPAAETFLRDVGDHLVEGVAIVVDYGMEEDELIRAHPRGTLEGIRGHRVSEEPLAEIDSPDLSVFVNWTRLRRAGTRAGLRLAADAPLADALLAWGIEPLARAAQEAATRPEDRVRLQLGIKNLLFGFERFRVLEFVAGNGTR